jgi:hypothetical protein
MQLQSLALSAAAAAAAAANYQPACLIPHSSSSSSTGSLTSEGAAAGLAVQLAQHACLGALNLADGLASLIALFAHIIHWGEALASDGALGGLGVWQVIT